MAVKVMLAPALVAREEERKARPAAEPRPKRRRSSVYDADGNEVFITLLCLKCQKMRPLSLFGLRRMADGAIRNQPWCRSCRAEASAANPKRRRGAAEAAAEPAAEAGDAAAVPEQPLDPGRLAAQVVAALHNGRR